jgi:hypothetical protein
MLNMSPRVLPAILAIDEAFRATFKGRPGQPVAFYSEYFEHTAFADDDSLEDEIAAYLRAKYSRTKLDIVAVTSSRGLRFAMRHRARLFPGVPIAFAAVDKTAAADVRLTDDVSGIWLSMDWAGTLDAALRLQPDTERAVVVTGRPPSIGPGRRRRGPSSNRSAVRSRPRTWSDCSWSSSWSGSPPCPAARWSCWAPSAGTVRARRSARRSNAV